MSEVDNKNCLAWVFKVGWERARRKSTRDYKRRSVEGGKKKLENLILWGDAGSGGSAMGLPRVDQAVTRKEPDKTQGS